MWLFASSDFRESSPWDSLNIFHSPSLNGPWTALADHPVKIDLRSSRPGGKLLRQDGKLYRPTQDCSKGYGSALTWTEITELFATGFSEVPVGRMSFGEDQTVLGPHTWNSLDLGGAKSLALVDCYSPRGSVQKA